MAKKHNFVTQQTKNKNEKRGMKRMHHLQIFINNKLGKKKNKFAKSIEISVEQFTSIITGNEQNGTNRCLKILQFQMACRTETEFRRRMEKKKKRHCSL